MTSRITHIPGIGRNLVAIWGLIAASDGARYATWFGADSGHVPYAAITRYVLAEGLWWCIVSWILFYVADVSADLKRPASLGLPALAVLLCAIGTVIENTFMLVTIGPFPHNRFANVFPSVAASDFHVSLLFIVMILGLGRGLQWGYVQRSAGARHAWLESTRKRAELAAVAGELEPHFLFNTLNGISVMISHDTNSARTMLNGLAGMLDYSLQQERDSVTLGEELHFTEHFLALQAIRFGRRLQTTIDVEPGARCCMVPKLILQPIVENAIRHGVEQIEQGGSVSIIAQLRRGRLSLLVRNSDPGPDAPISAGSGVGLASVRARLDLMFGTLHSLRIERDAAAASVVVSLSMPAVERPS